MDRASGTGQARGRQQGPGNLKQTFEKAGSWRLGIVTITYFIAIAGFAIVTVIYPQVSHRRFELNQSQISFIFVMVGLIGAAIQGGGIGRLVKRFGDVNLAIAGFAIMAISMMMMPLAGSVPIFLLFTAGLAIGNSLSQPTVNAIASKGASAALQGRVLGVLQSAGSLGRVFGPVLAGFLLSGDHTRPNAQYGNTPFLAGGVIIAIAFGLATTLRQARTGEGRSSLRRWRTTNSRRLARRARNALESAGPTGPWVNSVGANCWRIAAKFPSQSRCRVLSVPFLEPLRQHLALDSMHIG